MRKVEERRGGIERGFRVFYPDVYILECSKDYYKEIRCFCGISTAICQARKSWFRTGVGDIVAADIDDLWCACGRYLATMDNMTDNEYAAVTISLAKDATMIG